MHLLQCVVVQIVCRRVFVHWSLKMVYDRWKTRGHNTASYCLLLILDFFFHVTRHTLYLQPLSPICFVEFHFHSASIWSGPQMWRRKKEKEKEKEICWFSLGMWVLNHYLLFRGCCCSEATDWRALSAVPNRNQESETLIKNPMKATSLSHSQSHTQTSAEAWWREDHQFPLKFKPLFFSLFIHTHTKALFWRCTVKESDTSKIN